MQSTLTRMNLNNHIQQILTRHGDIRLAILFGSLAGARATPRSDLDLAVQMDAPLTAETRISLIDDLSQATVRPLPGVFFSYRIPACAGITG